MTFSYYEKVGKEVRNINDEIPFDLPQRWIWCRGYSCFDGMESTKPQGDFFDYIDINSSEEIALGKGAVLGIPDITSLTEHAIYDKILKAAERIGLNVQLTACSNAREIDALKSVHADLSAIQILVPCRNANTDVCIINENDIKSVCKVIQVTKIVLSDIKGEER